MSLDVLRIIIAGALLLHGIAHAVALVATLAQALSAASASKLTIRTWLSPRLKPRSAAVLAIPFWGVSTICFFAASAAFWGLISIAGWRQLAVAGAILSTLGMGLFPATWPGAPDLRRSILNTSIALGFNIVILGTQLLLHWPPFALFMR